MWRELNPELVKCPLGILNNAEQIKLLNEKMKTINKRQVL